MANFLIHQGATVLCQHSGQAQPVSVYPRVKVNNQPIVLQTSMFSVAACSLAGSGSAPCATAQWTTASTRIKAGGVPVVLNNSQAVCVPTGTGLRVVVTQTRVCGQ